MLSALGWALIQGEALDISKNLCEFSRETEGIDLRNAKSGWLVPDPFFCSVPGRAAAVLRLRRCASGLPLLGSRTAKVPPAAVGLNRPVSESGGCPAVPVTLVGSVERPI